MTTGTPVTHVRFAVIGCGSVARNQHIPNIAQSSRMTLHTCVDLDDAVLAECRVKYGALHNFKVSKITKNICIYL